MTTKELRIIEILKKSKTIAVMGCSRDQAKSAHYVPKYLKEKGYEIIPINPSADEILGLKAYSSLDDLTESVDIVQFFRSGPEITGFIDQALRLEPTVIWMQQGIVNQHAMEIFEKKGIMVVMDKCMMAEHKRLLG